MEISVLIINTGLYEICQNIIFIRRTNKLSDWQAHFLCIICGKNITEVTCRNDNINLIADFNFVILYKLCIWWEIIYNLRNKSAPVDWVCRWKLKLISVKKIFIISVCKYLLNTALSIVKVTLNRGNTYVITLLSNHLKLLNFTYTVVRIEYDNSCACNIFKAFKCSLTCITRCCNKDYDFFIFISLFHWCCKKMRKNLKCHILKSTSRAVP